MPVLITGATGLVGRALAKRLASEGAQVRAYVRRDDAELRAVGVHLAIGAIDDVQRLEAALTRVHTIVHLVGGFRPERGSSYDFLNRESTEAAMIAARAAEVRRFLFLSFVGADPSSRNEFLSSKGRAEEHIRSTELEHAIFRCAPILEALANIAPSLRSAFGVLPARGKRLMNPVPLARIVDALVAADARDSSLRATYELGGEESLTLREWAERFPGPARTRLPAPALEVFSSDVVADPDRALRELGVPRHDGS